VDDQASSATYAAAEDAAEDAPSTETFTAYPFLAAQLNFTVF